MPWDERTKRRLKLRDLDILLAVVEAGSMGKAAKRLNISQPAVSKAIAEMEDALGVHLVDRSQSGIEPTPYVALRNAVRQFPSAPALAALRVHEVRYVIVHRGGFGPNKWERIARDLPAFTEGDSPRLRPVAELDGDRVLEIVR